MRDRAALRLRSSLTTMALRLVSSRHGHNTYKEGPIASGRCVDNAGILACDNIPARSSTQTALDGSMGPRHQAIICLP
ncbi:hypothetical protein C8T65DRAFT_632653 [Cerioporus squamosus]|nr:hypothetical protein C8T65DRAFT_632653 [Cerioporus squamosus]